MIYDRLEFLGNYKGITPALDEAIDFIATHDLTQVGLDKVTLSDKVRYFGQQYIGKNEKDALYEVHHRAFDIQIVISGKEKMCSNPSNVPMHPANEYNPEKDVQKFQNDMPAATTCICSDMEFCIFFNNEFHMPCVNVDGKEIKKVVFKIAA